MESGQASDHNVNMGDREPRLGAGDGSFPVPRQAAAASEPGECALDDPSARQNLEATSGVGALDDLDPPVALAFQRAAQLRPRVAAIVEDMPQPRPAFANQAQDHRPTVAVLHAGRMHDGADYQAQRVGH
jgi:hypothetical protein